MQSQIVLLNYFVYIIILVQWFVYIILVQWFVNVFILVQWLVYIIVLVQSLVFLQNQQYKKLQVHMYWSATKFSQTKLNFKEFYAQS